MRKRFKPTPAQQEQFNVYVERRRNLGQVIFTARCDKEGCSSTFEGTHRQRRKVGWATVWRRNKGVEVQIDLCPWCRTGVPKKQAAA